MSKKNMISIVLYGEVNTSPKSWLEWFDFSIGLSKDLGNPLNYLGVIGESFNSGKILTLQRSLKRLKSSLDVGEQVHTVDFYSLPKGFVQAAFDYDLYMIRSKETHSHVLITMGEDCFYELGRGELVTKLKEHIEFSSGEIFEMIQNESPQFYAAKLNSPSTYKTLNVIEVIK